MPMVYPKFSIKIFTSLSYYYVDIRVGLTIRFSYLYLFVNFVIVNRLFNQKNCVTVM